MATGALHLVEQVGVFTPKSVARDSLSAGGVGFIIAGIKELKDAKVGDTVTLVDNPAAEPLPGFKEIQPQVFAGLYPVESNRYEALRDALAKLQLNDSSLRYEPETSQALGFGFRCGFLGLLHMDIVQERLEREYDMELITTAPDRGLPGGQARRRGDRDRQPVEAAGPVAGRGDPRADHPRHDPHAAGVRGPGDHAVRAEARHAGEHAVRRPPGDPHLRHAVERDRHGFLRQAEVELARLRLARLRVPRVRAGDLVRLDILINGDKVDALSLIVHRETARYRGRDLVTRMRELIPRQMFDVAVQAAIGSDVVARDNIKALRKNVLAKCYGGDITRKRKLLEKQKAGKKRMKQVGIVEIPQEAFLAILQGRVEIDKRPKNARWTGLGVDRAGGRRGASAAGSSCGTGWPLRGGSAALGHAQGHPRGRRGRCCSSRPWACCSRSPTSPPCC
jgi:GTP-binding protein LepA